MFGILTLLDARYEGRKHSGIEDLQASVAHGPAWRHFHMGKKTSGKRNMEV
jgi:hypothetical protein